ncbi:MAG: DUF1350 family protein [Cyanobacteria bacterium RM1_2_2]|nr:DUF1350 family protein [Cyanobacteria bacterium RM1_2_2]
MASQFFRFQPLSFSWIALHPNPKGIIFFIGGAFFGTLPTLFYRYFLQSIFESGYTVVALPFRFTFQHWLVATGLLQEQRQLRPVLIKMAQRAGYSAEIYRDAKNYFWIGHSLGCKYVALLELLSDHQWQENSRVCLQPKQAAETITQVTAALPSRTGILNQASILIAPDISDTDSAIPKPLARIVDALGLGVNPSRQQTQCLIENSRLFNLTALISFDRDTIAGSVQDQDETKSDVRWLLNHLSDRNPPHSELSGKHLEPVGIRFGKWIVDLNPLDKFIAPLSRRRVEATVLLFLEKLAQQ